MDHLRCGSPLAGSRWILPDATTASSAAEMSEPSEEGDRRSAQAGTDRRSPHTSIGADGTLIFGDRNGGNWQVYDRRAGDRRGSRVLGQSSGFDRVFVNAAGEEWWYELRAEELIDETAFTLERQLAHATRKTSGPSQ